MTGDGTDWIDKFAASSNAEKFRGAMVFTIGKYMSRMGRKDTVQDEVRKIADYANRWLKYEESLCNIKKQERYLTADGTDWIDKFAATASDAEFRGAMMFTIGKYMSRMGKKDTYLAEVTKIADYANRWFRKEED